MPLVHDFVPIEEDFEQAGRVLTSGLGSWLSVPALVALDGTENINLAFGDARMIERRVVVPLRWAASTGPFAALEADLRLEPIPPRRSHLSLSGRYVAMTGAADGHDPVTGQHLTESCIRRFLVGVATTLERGRAEFPP
jgi:hypothetical protein